jgi:hypothetical protein
MAKQKRIDGNVFLEWFKKFVRDNTQVFHGDEKGDHYVVDEEDLLFFTEQKINELATQEYSGGSYD